MSTRIQLRRGAASVWTSANPILADGEPGYEDDTGKLKIGDGTSLWSALPYQGDSSVFVGFSPDSSGGLGTSDSLLPTQHAVKTYVDGILDANNAFQYKGVIDCSANPNYPAASAGWSYKISVAGLIGGSSGTAVEVGDTAICIVDSSAAGNQATVGANWIVLQTNINGAVVGPSSSTASHFAFFAGTTGKVLSDSGLILDTDTTFAANSDTRVPSQKAVKAAIAAAAVTGQWDKAWSMPGSISLYTGQIRIVNITGRTLTISAVAISCGTSPTGASIIVDINKNGTTIFTTQANRPAIAASGHASGKVTNMDVTSLADGDYITIDVDQIGSTIAGSDLSVQVIAS